MRCFETGAITRFLAPSETTDPPTIVGIHHYEASTGLTANDSTTSQHEAIVANIVTWTCRRASVNRGVRILAVPYRLSAIGIGRPSSRRRPPR